MTSSRETRAFMPQAGASELRSLSGNESGNGQLDQHMERNRLLRAFPAEDYAWLAPHLSSVALNLNDVLAEANEPFRHVHFVESGCVSVVNTVAGGTVEVGTVGNEGIGGLPVFLGTGSVPSRTFVQIPGEARRISADAFAEAANTRPGIRRVMNLYTQAFLCQVAQTAACNRAHKLEERCARWLLMTHDRMEGAATFPLTHQFLAFMLGVRRSGVTIAAGALQQAGIIRYTRGKITVTDRGGLEEASCECYEIVLQEFNRLFGPRLMSAS